MELKYDTEDRCYRIASEMHPGHVKEDGLKLARRIAVTDALLAHCAPLEAEVARLQGLLQGKWRSVSEQPEDNKVYLIIFSTGFQLTAQFERTSTGRESWVWRFDKREQFSVDRFTPTHFRDPLPTPPQP